VPHTFVTDGIESASTQARAAAGNGSVALAGAQPVQQCLCAGLLDEITINVVPILLGGVRPFDHLGRPVMLENTGVVDAPGVTHLSYRITGPAARARVLRSA
jgi:dihydrofolate reductase